MPPLRRLKRRPEFLRAAAEGRKTAASTLVVQAVPRPDGGLDGDGDGDGEGPAIGVGFTASRKVGNAVARNRAKRRLRAAAAELLPIHGSAGHNYVLIARRKAVSCPYPELLADLTRGLRRLAGA